jgi:hypothetical protein
MVALAHPADIPFRTTMQLARSPSPVLPSRSSSTSRSPGVLTSRRFDMPTRSHHHKMQLAFIEVELRFLTTMNTLVSSLQSWRTESFDSQ